MWPSNGPNSIPSYMCFKAWLAAVHIEMDAVICSLLLLCMHFVSEMQLYKTASENSSLRAESPLPPVKSCHSEITKCIISFLSLVFLDMLVYNGLKICCQALAILRCILLPCWFALWPSGGQGGCRLHFYSISWSLSWLCAQCFHSRLMTANNIWYIWTLPHNELQSHWVTKVSLLTNSPELHIISM